ncbi:GDP-L-fucose synthase family protein [Tritonibacter mobilis]|jgi:GDP-L-fucose synthase|uniref:GDP-L-fucose synthase family protein n=1 Tax=Tritonibacter mobilis TaxID=379347 RepID=UPI003A5C436C
MTSEQVFDLRGKRIFVAGHRGMVGGAVLRRLAEEDCEVVTAGREDLDLTRQQAVMEWMAATRPDAIIMAAARVGGIKANSDYPVDFLLQNLQIETNLAEAAHAADVQRFLFLGSSCIYPKFAPQPIPEASLLTGALEPSNEWYAVAKIAGIKLMQAYRQQYGRDWISAMPTNLYGPGDNYDLETSHVLPALLHKFHTARLTGEDQVTLWGSGTPLREFLHCDDLADALVFLLKHYSGADHVNVGSGKEISIRALAELIAEIVGVSPELVFDSSKPDGTPRKLMDSARLAAMGWSGARPLRDGIAETYAAFVAQLDSVDA